MDNMTANKNHLSWVGPNGWIPSSTQGTLSNPLGSSQHISMGSSSDRRSSCNYLQGSGQGCVNTPSTITNTHHSSMYKASHVNPPSTTLFTNAVASNIFGQQGPHTSLAQLAANQQRTVPPTSLPQPNQPHPDSYRDMFSTPLTGQGLLGGLQDLSMILPSCGQRANTSQSALDGANVQAAVAAEYGHIYGLSAASEQLQWAHSAPCGRSGNKSVPDVSAHPQSQQPQKNAASTPNKIQRSLLLNQRAQLLQQLAEMNKLLDSIPPDDSGSVQPPNTAVQPEAHLSDDCPTPLSYQEPVETCDKNPAPAVPQKKDATPPESEDESDFDYVPSGNGESTESDWSSSDESIESLTSNVAEDETSSGKVKAESPDSLGKSAKKKMKRIGEAIVVSTSKIKEHRVYDRRNYCLFCSRPLSKMARHFERIHGDRPEVAVAFQYPSQSKERNKIWKKLINQGNFAHNKNVLKTGEGQLTPHKRPVKPAQASDYLHCLHCHGLFMKNNLFRHMKRCPERVKDENESQFKRKRVATKCALQTVELDVSDGFRTIVCEMNNDDVTKVIIADKVLLQYGEQMYKEYGTDGKNHQYIRQNLRQTARLVLEAQKTTPLKNLEDFFYHSSFRHVVSAVKVLAGYDPDAKTFSIPSLAVKLGYSLQKACRIVESNALECGDENLAKSAQNFLTIYKKKWTGLVSSGALSTLRGTKRNKDKKVPSVDDVRLLNSYLENFHELAEKNLAENPTPDNYSALAKVMLVRTILFNRRKAREVSTIQLESYMSRKRSNAPDDMDVSVTEVERNMCRYFTRIDIRGRCGRMVPVFLSPAFTSALELLLQSRQSCGVPGENLYLFARPAAINPFKGAESVQHYAKECGALNPEALTVIKILKHHAILLLSLNLTTEELLGIQYYTQSQGPVRHLDVDESQSDGTPHKPKQKWDVSEVCAVERHMLDFIAGHKVPQKNDCVQCLEAEPSALKNRSWKGVKDYVRNRITALKRESGLLEYSPRSGKRLRQEELLLNTSCVPQL